MSPRVVVAPGVWDLLHHGHVRFLERAAAFGDRLIVLVAGDALVEATKGKRPVAGVWERCALLKALAMQPETVIYSATDIRPSLEALGANVLAIGPEYGNLPEHEDVLAYCRAQRIDIHRIARTEGISTTELRERAAR